jgi:hypothetical protein
MWCRPERAGNVSRTQHCFGTVSTPLQYIEGKDIAVFLEIISMDKGRYDTCSDGFWWLHAGSDCIMKSLANRVGPSLFVSPSCTLKLSRASVRKAEGSGKVHPTPSPSPV